MTAPICRFSLNDHWETVLLWRDAGHCFQRDVPQSEHHRSKTVVLSELAEDCAVGVAGDRERGSVRQCGITSGNFITQYSFALLMVAEN